MASPRWTHFIFEDPNCDQISWTVRISWVTFGILCSQVIILPKKDYDNEHIHVLNLCTHVQAKCTPPSQSCFKRSSFYPQLLQAEKVGISGYTMRIVCRRVLLMGFLVDVDLCGGSSDNAAISLCKLPGNECDILKRDASHKPSRI